MRLVNLAFGILVGEAALVFAAPAGPDLNVCCCCDLSQPAIVCTSSMEVLYCSCLAVQCPEDAPTVWHYLDEQPPPAPPASVFEPDPEAGSDTADCCCCNFDQGAIVCNPRPAEEGCFCPLVVCPPDAPTTWPETAMPAPTPHLESSPEPQLPVATHHVGEDQEECCCCDIYQQAISCRIVSEDDGCFCAALVCPEGAPTVWPKDMPEMTPMPEAPVY